MEYVEKIQKGSLNIKLHELKDIKNKNSLCNLYSLYCNINHIYNSLIDSDIEEMIPIINKETIDKLEIYNKGIFNYDKIKSNTYYGIININARYRIKGNNKLDTVKEMIDNIKRWVSVKDRYSIDSVFMNLY